MYQRSYYPSDDVAVCPPREYDGSLNFEKEDKADDMQGCKETCCAEEKKGCQIPLLNRVQSLLGGFELGIEEILIIGAAIFLFMSKSGDFECIFILIALLFIR